MKTTKKKFKFVQYVAEDHNKPIFSVRFNNYVTNDMFATVGSNRVTVYHIVQDEIQPILCFADPDPNECFYCCAWALDSEKKETVLLAAGAQGIIRIISPSNPTSIKYFSGHGGAINDLKVSPTNHDLVLSASKDHSLRLWNVVTDVCIAIFGGVEGHRDEVLSSDFHYSGTKIVSCGMDHSLKLWSFGPDVLSAIEASKTFNDVTSRRSFPTVRKHFPTYSTRDVHRNYVDCVVWYGNFILSKSCENIIVCWRPGKQENSSDISLPTKYTSDSSCSTMENFEIKDPKALWFLKFSIDTKMKYLAAGNSIGKTFIFELDSHDHDSKTNDRYVLYNAKCQSAIRQTCFNNDSKILICTCDDGTLWRWDLQS